MADKPQDSGDAEPVNVTVSVKDFESVVVTEEELAAYRAAKQELADLVKKEGAAFFLSRGPCTGLVNQGATCYMNSLLQSLFMTPQFRSTIYKWKYGGEERDGKPESCIPLQIQRLFARLQLAACAAISTKDLTTSFGWTAAQAFRQHDVQELCRVLFDAIEEATPDKKIIGPIFEGKLIDFLRCMSCGFSRTREDVFQDLDLTVAGMPSVEASLRSFVTPEMLEGDNCWYCERCKDKVVAEKGLAFAKLPDVLTLHLKRFVFDFDLRRRVKLHDKMTFPLELDMSQYLPESKDGGSTAGTAAGAGAGAGANSEPEDDADDPEQSNEYELYSVLIHHGTAMGGHYFAYIKPPGESNWLEFNDAVVKDLGEKGEDIVLGRLEEAQEEEEAEEKKSSAEQDSKGKPGDATSKEDKTEGKSADGSPAAAGGNDEAGGDSADAGSKATDGPDAVPPSGTGIPRSRAAGKAGKGAKATGTTGNAYMLMYRRKSCKTGAEYDFTVPEDIAGPIIVENEASRRIMNAFAVKQKVVELAVHRDPSMGGPAPAVPSSSGGAAAETESAAPSTSRRMVCLDLPKSCTLTKATDLAYESLLSVEERRSVARHNVRLREFVPSCRRPTTTYEGKEDDSLQACGLSPAKTMVLEVRDEGEPWVAFNPNEMIIRVIRWGSDIVDLSDPMSLAPESVDAPDDMVAVVRVPGDQEATVEALQTAVACSPLGLPAVSQRLLKLGSDGDAVILRSFDKQLRRDYGIWSGEDVFVEVIGPGETIDGPSPALAAYDSARNVVTLLYNNLDCPDPPEYPNTVVASLRESLETVKARIAEELDVSPEDIHLKRNGNKSTPQLKNEAATLRELGLVDSSVLFVGKGAPLNVDEFLLKLYIYDPTQKQKFKLRSEVPAAATQRIGALKRRLSEALEHPANCLRLRLKTGHEAGKIFRDDRTVRSVMTNLQDGKEIAVQLLNEPESVGPEDMVLSVRVWRPLTRKVDPVVELVLPRKTSVAELRVALRDRFLGDSARHVKTAAALPPPSSAGSSASGAGADGPNAASEGAPAGDESGTPAPATDGTLTPEEREAQLFARAQEEIGHVPDGVGVVKYLQLDMALNMARLKALKWNDPSIEEESVISSRPLGLRDGNMLILRDELEYALAKECGLLKPSGSKAGGAGVPSRLGARRSNFGRGARRKQPAYRETGLTIQRRRPGGSAGGSSAGDAESGETAGGSESKGDDAEPETPGRCDSCGVCSSPQWDSTTVEGMTLCGMCASQLGGGN